jgi:hypothetical protein
MFLPFYLSRARFVTNTIFPSLKIHAQTQGIITHTDDCQSLGQTHTQTLDYNLFLGDKEITK